MVRRFLPSVALLAACSCGTSTNAAVSGTDASTEAGPAVTPDGAVPSGSDAGDSGGEAVACPATEPSGPCSSVGQQCGYGCTGCSCTGTGWYCAQPGCAGGCPGMTSAPAEGTACGGCCGPSYGESCDYVCPGGEPVTVTCESTTGWHLNHPCGDAGSGIVDAAGQG
jgi:hypothetical protein